MRVETTIGIKDQTEPAGESLECAIVGEAESERGDDGTQGWSVHVVEARINGYVYRLTRSEMGRALDAIAEQAARDWNDSREAAVGL